MAIQISPFDPRSSIERRPGQGRNGEAPVVVSRVRLTILVALLALIVVTGLLAWPA